MSSEETILRHLNDIYKQLSPKFERCTGISQSRLDLLHKLMEVDEISQRALQREVNIDNAAVTRHLKQLEAKGMVSRRKNPDDNRITFVSLTDEGRERTAALCKEKKQFISQMLKDFSTDEQEMLSDLLMRIQQNGKNIQY
ncbi:MarR family transcriptional regulator [[Bacillus] enclensis]|uniref:DNA-binding transcriptional regulator, MarR family n=1 Tax=[Bacillus] enclensis TaxID=1402860 RepID=A0A0V8HHI3_9BACI|nr:MarR family transcriptional regulator [[Bacillus] enclensis]KSU61890.1 MarR family transcriptional regulator [[Bacillus] enclensis]SCC16731.1 DNA-binding transcriptional regulator, MarR family [[Bacillus] enclensis]